MVALELPRFVDSLLSLPLIDPEPTLFFLLLADIAETFPVLDDDLRSDGRSDGRSTATSFANDTFFLFVDRRLLSSTSSPPSVASSSVAVRSLSLRNDRRPRSNIAGSSSVLPPMSSSSPRYPSASSSPCLPRPPELTLLAREAFVPIKFLIVLAIAVEFIE